MIKIKLAILLLFIPFLLSFNPISYDSSYYAKYTSPEGIQFLSYTENWNQSKLEGLYMELIKNKHGEEIHLLKEIRVRGGGHASNPLITGQYFSLTNSITLFNGDTFLEPAEFSGTLSHEYGHHFTYHHLKEHHFPFSSWSKLRGLDHDSIRWDAFWNYTASGHMWYPQEIAADDYVLLYGATKEVQLKDVYSNEAFYRKTIHDNQKLKNVLENKELQRYLEEVTNISVEEDRYFISPTLNAINENTVNFNITPKKNMAYRLNATIHLDEQEYFQEVLTITNNDSLNIISFSFAEILKDLPDSQFVEKIEMNIDVLDLKTSIGLQTETHVIELNKTVNN
ncbi:hypothetical protein [Litchfieldia alkalitelluris]|uniref:hypothetical protein n=1 Tax=Litchfieldia alkalitelluris TaxID=304268 RepID=UPI00099899CB|nr:hypothetical protein [Litchfieldia alkalitelluris]